MTMKQILILCLCVCLCGFEFVDSGKRPKRMVGGRDLPGHEFYNTQFVVSLHLTFDCLTDQFDHQLLDCNNALKCGGSLISADFVMTACHCISYTKWYAKNLIPPIRENLTSGDIPPYIDDRIHNKPREEGDPLFYRKEVRVEHPLHTELTIFAGNHLRSKSFQRRHSAKFFVHHLCGVRERDAYPELWAGQNFELDIGLVRTCYPFNLTSEVTVAPLRPWNRMEEHLLKIVEMSATCLIVGWGYALENINEIIDGFEAKIRFAKYLPDMLQHTFRYIEGNRDCTFDRHNCILCSRHHGPKMSVTRSGDSGSPLICDGVFTAVHSRGFANSAEGWLERNYTVAKHIAVACVKDFISNRHLSYLRSLSEFPFHYLNGVPDDGTFP